MINSITSTFIVLGMGALVGVVGLLAYVKHKWRIAVIAIHPPIAVVALAIVVLAIGVLFYPVTAAAVVRSIGYAVKTMFSFAGQLGGCL